MAFTLPSLPYAHNALEPHVDARTMEIHHGKHHNAYVTNLNNATAGTDLESMSIEDVLRNMDKVPADKKAAVQPGSSIMPGKVNPVLAEMLNQAMFHVQGCDLTVSLAAQAGQLELNVMMPIIAHNLFEMMQVTIGAVNAFAEKCVRGLKANRLKAEGWLAKNAIIITALNPVIGYLNGAALVKEAIARDLPVGEVAVEKANRGELKHFTEDRLVTAEEIINALGDLRKLTEGGLAEGVGGGG